MPENNRNPLQDMAPESMFTAGSTQQELTYGQKLVGLTFNPSGDVRVNEVKVLFAKAADLLYDYYHSQESTQLSNQLFVHTIGEILNAQMNVVKVLTLKY